MDEIDFTISMLLMANSRIPYKDLAEKMMDAWISFARTGNPNHKNIPKFPPYDLEKRATIVFDKEVTVKDDPYSSERKSWDGIL